MALTFTEVVRADNRGVVVRASDGNTYTLTGSRSQRNNNPGAIAWSPVARDFGAIGYDTVSVNGQPSTHLAIFPTMAAGQAAQRELLFGNNPNHPQYANRTLAQAISAYAPGGVDGNGPSSAYAQRIADSLGVSLNTRLSDLTPAQRAAFMEAQAQIESGGRGQIITDSQGNAVRFPPADIPLPTNSSGGPDDRAISGLPPNVTPIPLAPFRSPAAFGGNAGDALAFGASSPLPLQAIPSANAGDSLAFNPTLPDMSSALPLASVGSDGHIYMGAPDVPQTFGPAGGAYAPPLPSFTTSAFPARPDLVAPNSLPPPLPIPRPDVGTINPNGLPALPVAQSAPTVNIGGHTYTVGDVLSTPNGYSYKVNADGTMTKLPHMTLGTNTIAGGMAGQAVKDALTTAQTQAPAALAAAGQKLGGFLGGLFGGSSANTPNGGTPVPPMDVPKNTTSSVSQSYGPAGGYYSPPPLPDVPQSYGPAGGYYSPPPIPTSPFSNPGVQGLSPDDRTALPASSFGLDLGLPAAAARSVPKTITTYQSQQTLNPAYTSWVNNQNSAIYGVSGVDTPTLDANGNVTLPSSYLGASTPAPPKYITQTVYKPNPAYTPTPVIPLSPPPGELAALRAKASPFDTWFAGTPLGHLTSFLGGNLNTSYGAPHQGGLLSMLGGGFGGPSAAPPILQQLAAFTPQQYANQNASALAALRSGQTSYTNDSGTLMPTVAMNGMIRNTYADNPNTQYGGSDNYARTGST